LDHLIVVAISQWRRRLSARIKAHGGHFEHFFGVFMVQYVKLMLIVLNFWFYCLTALFVAKM